MELFEFEPDDRPKTFRVYVREAGGRTYAGWVRRMRSTPGGDEQWYGVAVPQIVACSGEYSRGAAASQVWTVFCESRREDARQAAREAERAESRG